MRSSSGTGWGAKLQERCSPWQVGPLTPSGRGLFGSRFLPAPRLLRLRLRLNHGWRRMNLISFHRFLITTAIFFCGGYAAWEFAQFNRSGALGSMVQGLIFSVLALALIVYFNRMASFLGYQEEDE